MSDKILSFILVKADPLPLQGAPGADEDLAVRVLSPLLDGGVLQDDGLFPGPARTSLE